ncbi:MAG: hypothetical protein NT036_02155 [Candidatus Omnitrophica bacterium]|nr:hypothetical protein [Candidatus Omnitrophota bacterium]
MSMRKITLVLVGITALLFTSVCSDCANAAGFKSEDELVDETRENVEKHLNDKWQAPKPTMIAPVPVPVVEDKPALIETPTVETPTVETPAVETPVATE